MGRSKKTEDKSYGKHSKEVEKSKKINNKAKKSSREVESERTKKSNNKIENQSVKKSNREPNNKKTIKTKKKAKTVRKVKRVVVTLLLLSMIGAGTLFGYKIYKNGGGLTGTLATLLGGSAEELTKLEPIQILIMGESGVDDYKLADSIMIASYNPKTQDASILSLPRDTYVGKKNRKTATQNYLASYKINTVFRNGTNIPEAIDRINELTGLDLEKYVIIDTKALVKLVDAIGGVTFNVPIDMDYEDSSQDLYIHLKAGEQLIDGPKAEQLLRFRHNDDGSTYPSSYGQQDFGRMRTQREFIIATLKQTLKPYNIFKIKQIIDIMEENVKTNVDFATVKAYVPSAVKFNAENIKTDMVPGDVEMCNGVSLYIANTSKTKKIVSELFKIEDEDSDTTNTDTSSTTKNK